MYTVKPQNGINVNEALGPRAPYPLEKEVAVPGGIRSEDIMGARRVGGDGRFEGPFIKNPNYSE